MTGLDPRDRADWQAHHPAPAEWAKPGDHRRTRIVWFIGTALATFAVWCVVLWLCSGVGAI